MFTEFDVAVSVIIIISVLISYLRGFLKDILSFAGWLGAGIATIIVFPYAALWLEDMFKSSKAINIIGVIVVFMICLGFVTLLNAMILDNLRNYRKGPIDRLAGVIFGAVRGFVIVSLIHYSVTVLAGDEDPDWLEEGQTYEMTKKGADYIAKFADEYIEKPKLEVVKDVQEKIEDGLPESIKD